MTLNTISSKSYIDAIHIEDALVIDDTSDTSGINGLPKTKKFSPEQGRNYTNLGYGIPLQNFQAKLANVKKGLLSRVRIGVLCDSTGAGKGAGGGDPWGNSFPAVLTQLFQKAGFNATNAAFYASGDGTNATSTYNSKRLTLSGAWATQATPTLGGNLYLTTTTAGSLSFTPTDVWDTAYIPYLTNSTQGTFTTDIDGGSPTTTNGNGSTAMASLTMTAAAPGIHTLNYKYVSGTKVFVSGAECYNSKLSQVVVVNCGWGGVTTGGIAAGTGAFDPIFAYKFAAFDLTIFGTVINDWLQLTNQATLATNVQALITAAKLSGDCIWMLSVPSGINNTALATQQSYCAVVRAVCLANNVPVVEVFDRFQSYEISNALTSALYSDTIHPNGAGYEIMANAVFNALNVKATGASTNMGGFPLLIQTVANNTYTYVGYAGCAGTILGIYEKARALTTAGTFVIAINGVTVTGLSAVVPSTAGSYTNASALNVFNRGDQITITYSGSSVVLDHTLALDYTQII